MLCTLLRTGQVGPGHVPRNPPRKDFVVSYALYIASALGAVALFMLMPRQRPTPRALGGLLGALVLGGLWLYLARFLPTDWGTGQGGAMMAYYYIFSAIGIVAAVRVITHTRPVYSALWFVMVMLATSGLFLLLWAQFMALAMIIIYGGAILVTYVFVIMLATQSGHEGGPSVSVDAGATEDSPSYDRVAWEPVAAIATGFVLLAVLLTVAFPLPGRPMLEANADAAMRSDADLRATVLTHGPAERLALTAKDGAGLAAINAAQDEPGSVSNIERVGLDLFESHPLGLELAGVILLVSLIGAVVIAKQKVEGSPVGVGEE